MNIDYTLANSSIGYYSKHKTTIILNAIKCSLEDECPEANINVEMDFNVSASTLSICDIADNINENELYDGMNIIIDRATELSI